jgi:hypothetical protein
VTPAQAADCGVSDDFVCRLVLAHSRRSPELAAARRWRPGDVGGDVVALVGPTSTEEYPCFATTAKLFAIWHQGKRSTSRGFPVDGIGRWVHQLGVKDPKAIRLIGRIVAADTGDDLAAALTVLAAKRTRRSPHWETVLTELLRWADPAERTAIRFDWVRDFYRYVPSRTIATPHAGQTPTEEAL